MLTKAALFNQNAVKTIILWSVITIFFFYLMYSYDAKVEF